MALTVQMHSGKVHLDAEQERRVGNYLKTIEARVERFAEPVAILTLRAHDAQRRVTADLRVKLGTSAGDLVSHQAAESPDHAVRLATEDIERQLERVLSIRRGEATFGVPSRREPASERPHPRGQS